MSENLYPLLKALAKENENIKNGIYPSKFLKKILVTKFRNFPENGEIEFKSPLTAIVGRNGTGKTTLLYLVACAYAPIAEEKGKTYNDLIPESTKDHVPIDSQYGFIYENNTDNKFKWIERQSGGKRIGKKEWDKRHSINPETEKPHIRARNNSFFFGLEKSISNPFIFANHFNVTKITQGNRLKEIGKDNSLLVKLSDSLVKQISEIVGKNYKSIERRTDKYSLLHESSYGYVINGNYSDIASGAGEIAIIRLLDVIDRAPNNSLIIIDEPEIAIHPAAQPKLLEFLLKRTLGKNHQIIFTTHSYFLLKYLPPESITLLEQDASEKIESKNVNSSIAFKDISGENIFKIEAFVEDRFAANFLNSILNQDFILKDQLKVSVAYADGWNDFIKREVLCRFYSWHKHERDKSNFKPFFIFDGDVRKSLDFEKIKIDFDNASTLKNKLDKKGYNKIQVEISKCFKLNKSKICFKECFYKDKDSHSKLSTIISEYLGYIVNHHAFLPTNDSPETIIYKWIKGKINLKDNHYDRIICNIKDQFKANFEREFSSDLPSTDVSKSKIYKLKQYAIDNSYIEQHIINLWIQDKDNQVIINELITNLREVIGNI